LTYDYGKLDEAERLVEEAVELWKRKLGPEHSKTKMGLTYLAGLYHRQGEFEEAETMMKEFIRIRKVVTAR
jgi:tetratricopeptide (TPR) repeat protein